MARTNEGRFNETMAYLRGVSDDLANDVAGKVTDKAKTGKELSLEGAGFWKSGNSNQHAAVRAYLLCLIVYFRPPHADADWATAAIGPERRRLRGKAENRVKEEILDFMPDPNASLVGLAETAERVNRVGQAFYAPTRSRNDDDLPQNPICYDGVKAWLFGAGFVSKRWLAKKGSLTAYNSENIGTGLVVPENDWDKIPLGYIWNIQKRGDKSTQHWGVSLGNDMAVACNNTDESPKAKLLYEPGGKSRYGKFHFSNICEVLNTHEKYRADGVGTNIVVRQINPLTENSYF